MSNHLPVFGLSACDIHHRQSARSQTGDFGDGFKTLTISGLIFIDTFSGPKTGLKRPKRACKRATVVLRLWPFRFPTVALFASAESPKEKTEGLPPCFKTVFPFYLPTFCRHDFVKVVRLFPLSCSGVFHRNLPAGAPDFPPCNIDSPIKCPQGSFATVCVYNMI